MSDSSIVSPGGSSYSLPSPTSAKDGEIPKMSLERTLPRQLSTGSTRGTQTVGYGNTKIDGTNNTITMIDGSITITANDGSAVGLGKIPDDSGEFGFFSLDTSGNLIMKIVNGTKYVYDPSNDYVNITQDGLLPDGSGGFVVAKPGENVDSAFG